MILKNKQSLSVIENFQIKEKMFDLKDKHWYNANVVFV